MKHYARTLAFTTALGLTVAAPAFAADDTMGEIVVTARRVEERLQDVPISMTVINQQEISNRNIINSADLALFTPSLTINDRFGPEKASFVLRGFSQDLYTAPTVGVYFADVLAAVSGDATNAGNGAGIGSLFDLQNVQVLKGPQGTLFGRNTTGGAILLVPQKPTDKLGGYVEGSVGDYNMRRIEAVLNLPVNDKVKMRFGVDHEVRDGYEINHSGIGPRDFANVDFVSFRWSTIVNITPDLENYSILAYSDSHNHGYALHAATCNPAFPGALSFVALLGCGQLASEAAKGFGPRDVDNADPFAKNDQKQWEAINTTTWNVNDSLTLKNITSFQEFFESLRESLWGDFLSGGGAQPLFGLVQIGNMPGYHNAAQSTFSEELQLQGKAMDNKLTYTAGGYLQQSNPLGYDVQESAILLNCANPFIFQCAGFGNQSVPFIKNHFSTKGLYAQATYDITDQLSATAGIRYTWDKTSQYYAATINNYPTPNNPVATCQNTARQSNPDGSPIVIGSIANFGPCGETFAVSSHAPTWVLNLDYKPTPDTMVYAKWSRGYRAGGVADINPFFETWQPEKLDTYEIGTKDSFNGAVRGYIDADVYYNNFRNQQIAGSLITADPAHFVGGSAVINAGKSRIWGTEIDAAISPVKDITISVGYAYLNAKVQALTTPSVPAAASKLVAAIIPNASVGAGFILSPKNRINLTGAYDLSFVPENIGQVSVSATFTHTDSQIASTASDPRLEFLPAQNLLNLNMNWKSVAGQPVDLSAFVTNVANKYFSQNVGNSYPAFGVEYVIPNEPRMFGVRLKVHFG